MQRNKIKKTVSKIKIGKVCGRDNLELKTIE